MSRFWGNGKFPYTQLNNLNLDWLIKCVQELAAQIVEAVRGDIVQNKSAEWKARARQNIDAASVSGLASLSVEVDTLGDNVAEAVRGDVIQNKSELWKTQARQNIDAQSMGAVVDVAHGGTGATTVVDALTALGSAPLLYFSMTTTTLVLQFSAAVRFLIVITSNTAAQHGAALVFCGRNSQPVTTPLGTLGSSITLTGGVSSLTVTLANANSTTSVSILCLTAASYSRITVAQTNSLSTLSEGQTTRPAELADGEITRPSALADGEIINPSALAEE